MKIARLVPVLLASVAIASPAAAAEYLFQFDSAASSIAVTENGRACFPAAGCALSATLLTPFSSLLISEGSSASFNFASFNVSPGFGGDSDARVEAELAFITPGGISAGTGGTASYLRLGGFLTPGAVGGSLIWDNPVQTLLASDGTAFTVTFSNLTGVTFGSNAVATVTVGLNEVGAVPEPATWALMAIGFGAVGMGLRGRRRMAAAA